MSALHPDVSADVNALTARIDQVGLAQAREEYHRAAIDTVMRETVALVADVAAAQFEALRELDATGSLSQIAFDEILGPKIAQIRDDAIANNNGVLDARTHYMDGPTYVELTTDKKDEVRRQFANHLDENIAAIRAEVVVSERTDVTTLLRHLEERAAVSIETFSSMMETKTKQTDFIEGLQRRMEGYARERQGIINPTARNVHSAAQLGDVEKLTELMHSGAALDRPNDAGWRPLHIAAAHGKRAAVELLIQKRHPIDCKTPEGYTPLHFAAKHGHTDIARLLIRAKADVEALGEYERRPIHIAAHNGRAPIVKLLIQNDVNPNTRTNEDDHCLTALHSAVLQYKTGVVLELLKSRQLAVNTTDRRGMTPLRYAVEDGRLDMVPLIVEHPSRTPLPNGDSSSIPVLLLINCRQNQEAIRAFLNSIALPAHPV